MSSHGMREKYAPFESMLIPFSDMPSGFHLKVGSGFP
jgi:hypothetical protein